MLVLQDLLVCLKNPQRSEICSNKHSTTKLRSFEPPIYDPALQAPPHPPTWVGVGPAPPCGWGVCVWVCGGGATRPEAEIIYTL